MPARCANHRLGGPRRQEWLLVALGLAVSLVAACSASSPDRLSTASTPAVSSVSESSTLPPASSAPSSDGMTPEAGEPGAATSQPATIAPEVIEGGAASVPPGDFVTRLEPQLDLVVGGGPIGDCDIDNMRDWAVDSLPVDPSVSVNFEPQGGVIRFGDMVAVCLLGFSPQDVSYQLSGPAGFSFSGTINVGTRSECGDKDQAFFDPSCASPNADQFTDTVSDDTADPPGTTDSAVPASSTTNPQPETTPVVSDDGAQDPSTSPPPTTSSPSATMESDPLDGLMSTARQGSRTGLRDPEGPRPTSEYLILRTRASWFAPEIPPGEYRLSVSQGEITASYAFQVALPEGRFTRTERRTSESYDVLVLGEANTTFEVGLYDADSSDQSGGQGGMPLARSLGPITTNERGVAAISVGGDGRTEAGDYCVIAEAARSNSCRYSFIRLEE